MFEKYKVFIFSEDPDKLVTFYTDILGWSIVKKLEYDLDYGYTLEISKGGMQVWLARHSKVKGKSRDPFRHILNLYVTSIEEIFDKVRAADGVEVVAEPFAMGEIIPGEERWACTILDPEGNCLQFMGPLKKQE